MSKDAWEGIPELPEDKKPKDPRGAPKGKPHAYPTGDDKQKSYLTRKAEAKALFIRGYAPRTISKQVDVPPSVINKWAEDEGWREERDVYQENTTRDKLQDLEASHDLAIMNLEEMKKKAVQAIETLMPKKFSEAVTSYIAALETQKKIKVEAIEIKFLTEVARILREEIVDQELLKRIAYRLDQLYHQEQLDSLEQQPMKAIPETTSKEEDDDGEEDG